MNFKITTMEQLIDKHAQILKSWVGNSLAKDECIGLIKNAVDEALSLYGVSQQRELLKVFIDTDTDVDLVSGRKCRLLKHTEESFLIQYNHNDQIEWVGISELKQMVKHFKI